MVMSIGLEKLEFDNVRQVRKEETIGYLKGKIHDANTEMPLHPLEKVHENWLDKLTCEASRVG